MPRDRTADEQRKAAREQGRAARAQRRLAEQQMSQTAPTPPRVAEAPEEAAVPDTGTEEPRKGAIRTQTRDEALESGVASWEPQGEPHPETGVDVPDVYDEDDLAFDPTDAGGPIPDHGAWFRMPPFLDVLDFGDIGLINDHERGTFRIYSDRWVHVPAHLVQQVRTAIWNSYPNGTLDVQEVHEDPNQATTA